MTTEVLTRRSARRRSRQRVTFTGVLGELLITVGVLVLLYVAWQMWVGDWILGAQGQNQSRELTDGWANKPVVDPPNVELTAPEDPYNTVTMPPPEMGQPGSGEDFGAIYIPRLFGDASFTVAGGTQTWESLDLQKVGHYNDTGMPGMPGNFAIAGHRGSHGAPFMNLPELKVDDAIVVETDAGWYTYRYRNMEYVEPSAIDVLDPTPRNAAAGVTGSYITMTTCSPRYGFSERLIAYGTFESFTPRTSDGKKPESLVLAKGD